MEGKWNRRPWTEQELGYLREANLMACTDAVEDWLIAEAKHQADIVGKVGTK